jgi:hypothetical protein
MVQHGGQKPPDVGFFVFSGRGDVVSISATTHGGLSVDSHGI